jgi:hypothetical protein
LVGLSFVGRALKSPVVFHTADDLEALFASFGAAGTGAVRSVELFPSLLEDRPNAAVVRFGQRADAERAKRSLEGRTFDGREVRPAYVHPLSTLSR